jgi:hypothetical protein
MNQKEEWRDKGWEVQNKRVTDMEIITVTGTNDATGRRSPKVRGVCLAVGYPVHDVVMKKKNF